MRQEKKEHLEHLLFTTSKSGEKSNRCAIALTSKYAVTYKHVDVHSSLEKGDKLVLHNVHDSTIEIEVVVVFFSKTSSIVVFEAIDTEFEYYPSDSNSIYPGEEYFQLGINQDRELVWKEGKVSKRCSGYYLGTSRGECTNFGAGIFDSFGLFIGMSSSKDSLVSSNLDISSLNINDEEIMNHLETKIICANVVYGDLPITNSDYWSSYSPT